MITRPEHVALSVQNLDRSIAFYRDLLGMNIVRILQPEATAEKLGELVALLGSRARIAHLELNGFMLEIFEYIEPRGQKIKSETSQANHGFIHFGFTSTDVRGDYAELSTRGVEFLSPPVEFRPDFWLVYFRGPDGEVCELRQSQAITH